MAFAATTHWEIEAAASDNNGGGFDPGNVNMATDLAATSGTGTAPVVSSASYNFVAGDVGAWVYVKSGTNWFPGWYKISSVAANAATVDATTGHWIDATTMAPSTKQGIASVASPTTGTWSVDYSQQTGAKIAFTDMVIDATTNTKFTSAANPVGKNFIGNVINVTGGTGFTVQRVQVVSTATTVATCDKSLGTLSSTGGTGNLGGALASLGIAASVQVSSNFIWQQSGSYTITSASANVSGGTVLITLTGCIEGYGTYRGDLGTQPVNTASGISTATLVTLSNNLDSVFRNIKLDGALLTALTGVSAARAVCDKLTLVNFTNSAIKTTNNSCDLLRSLITGCTTQPAVLFTTGTVHCIWGCEISGNSVTGFSGGATIIDCLIYNNTGATSDGLSLSGPAEMVIMNVTSYGNGRDGFRIAVANTVLSNCIAENSSGFGFNDTLNNAVINNCAGFNNTSGNVSQTLGFNKPNARNYGFIAYTSTAFNNAAGNDFSLNNTAGGGASLRAAGIPGTFPSGSTIGHLDVGAVQHGDPLSNLLVHPGMQGGMRG